MANKSIWKSEAQFQAACVKKFDQSYPEQRGRLIGIYNNPPNAVVAAMLISMGLRPGISDLLYFPETKYIPYAVTLDEKVMVHKIIRVAWIELKILGGKQKPNQERFEETVKGFGHDYFVVEESLDLFINTINLYL